MKSIVLSCVLCCSLLTLFAQEDIKTNGLYYKISVATTLTTNEEYTLFNDDDESFLAFNAVFINNSIGYQFDNRASIDLNGEYDHHSRKNLNFLPVFLGFNYNILDFDDVLFIRGGYGRLLKAGKNFEKGTMYKVGIGYRTFDGNFKNSWLIGLDFNRKRFGYKQQEKLSSVSVFLEFMVF
ncbi:hypothetical protein [Gelidibacter pelagius]|uniref:Outer membrane protein with beta-barrel domain n=1 Tax=Gelidibacter pelagius TaxID=2819985 RepID=A0ABS3STU5_9FLAO|nr:hypothetical protein [Gelidibacter pelagius]MBO3099100.1 hypothetical protein [Gelidibacter pelagius]